VTSKHRGMFGCALALAQSIGLEFILVVGEIIPNWRITAAVSVAPLVMGTKYFT